ncbi:MAG TPA: LPS export ABC transporter periplasmic protein LptC [Xanthobacteraceae bacterium]|nr:LPS export ABC transporter periplasmic protein LptC [Xanthobacteraceae bacterium]
MTHAHAHPSGRPDRASARGFRAARRHSRIVRWLRRGIPAAVVGGLAVVALVSWFNPLRALTGLSGLDLGSLVVSGSKIKMESPRLAGFTPDARAYEFVAKAAAQDLTHPDMVELTDIRAKVEMPDKAVLNLSARSGLFDSKKDMLTLTDDIRLQSPAYEGRLEEAVVNIRTASVESKRPVRVRMIQGDLTANGLAVSDSGDVVRFLGGVNLSLAPGAFRGEAAEGGHRK